MLALVALLAAGIGIGARVTHVTRSLEDRTLDTRFAIRGRTPIRSDMAIVAIDGKTFSDFTEAHLHSQWPLPRRYYARVIDNLHRAGARVIAIDIQFTEPTDPNDDGALYDAIGRAGHMVLATAEVRGNGQTAILGGNANLAAVGARPGDSNFPQDSDGVFRRMQYSIQGLKTFGVAVAEADGHHVSSRAFGRRGAFIDFRYPAHTISTVSLSDVYTGHFAPATFRGKIVFLGATATSLQDIHPTPTSSVMSGPELQANAAATVLEGIPVRPASGTLDTLLIVLLGVTMPLVSMRFTRLRSLLVTLAVESMYVVAVQIAFDHGLVLDLIDPLLALLVATLGSLAVLYLAASVERERVRSLFARFVPSAVVDQVMARADENLRLGAVERDCTVLFSDLRGFTAFSESQPPQRVLDVVNFYLDQMTAAILAAGGTLISYMGDGIMALFGAPLEQPDHADRALAAAREMTGARLDAFNQWMVQQGFPTGFRMGVGLHSGMVMAGNVGSEERLDYTAIGDTTNTASRLEGMTKGTPHMLFVSGETRARMHAAPADLVYVDDLEVRGRAERIAVWSLVQPAAPVDPGPAGEPAVTPVS